MRDTNPSDAPLPFRVGKLMLWFFLRGCSRGGCLEITGRLHQEYPTFQSFFLIMLCGLLADEVGP